ncbi:hypothetical protein NKI88_26820 [Mesorhizobium sp. M0317]|uniref:hypothetical protein n=1 Tax=Mesorhizobium sp. M0317 TaxID=2956935 RepID=UPI0033385D82
MVRRDQFVPDCGIDPTGHEIDVEERHSIGSDVFDLLIGETRAMPTDDAVRLQRLDHRVDRCIVTVTQRTFLARAERI